MMKHLLALLLCFLNFSVHAKSGGGFWSWCLDGLGRVILPPLATPHLSDSHLPNSHLPAPKQPSLEVQSFVSRLRAQGISNISIDLWGNPVVFTSGGSVRIPVYRGEVADIAMGRTYAREGDEGTQEKALLSFGLNRGAVTYLNWQVVQMPKNQPLLFSYPETLISSSWELSQRMDFTILQGRSIHFNVHGMEFDTAVKKYREIIQNRVATDIRAPDWELGRIIHGILGGHYPRTQILFWNNDTPVPAEQVDALIARFRAIQQRGQ